MPIYVYGCRKCGAVEEHIQRFSDPPLTRCEACGGKLEKKVTSAAFHLKGGGWYRDGYASARPDGGGEAAGSDGGEASSTAKAEGGDSSSPSASPGDASSSSTTASESRPAKKASKVSPATPATKKSPKKKTKASA
jgi:putative FmdB family regulatory protein